MPRLYSSKTAGDLSHVSGQTAQQIDYTPTTVADWTSGDPGTIRDALDVHASVKLENIVEDLSPQLGADLDVNGFDIISASGDVDIAPASGFNVNYPGAVTFTNDANGAAVFRIVTAHDLFATFASSLSLRRSRIGPAATTSGDLIGNYFFEGHDGSDWQTIASIKGEASENTTASAAGGRLLFLVTQVGTTSLFEIARMYHDGTNGFVEFDNATGKPIKFHLNAIGAPIIEVASSAGLIVQTDGDLKLYAAQNSGAGDYRLKTFDANGQAYYNAQKGHNFLGTTDTSTTTVSILGNLVVSGDTVTGGTIAVYSDTLTDQPQHTNFRAGGTATAITATPSGAKMGVYQWDGAEDSTPTQATGAEILSQATALWSASEHGTDLVFKATPTGQTSMSTICTMGGDVGAHLRMEGSSQLQFSSTVNGPRLNIGASDGMVYNVATGGAHTFAVNVGTEVTVAANITTTIAGHDILCQGQVTATDGYVHAIANKTTTYTITEEDEFITADASGGAFTITLPTVSGHTGKVFHVKKTDSSANAVTVDGNGAETIDGSTTAVIRKQYDALRLVCDGTEWWIS